MSSGSPGSEVGRHGDYPPRNLVWLCCFPAFHSARRKDDAAAELSGPAARPRHGRIFLGFSPENDGTGRRRWCSDTAQHFAASRSALASASIASVPHLPRLSVHRSCLLRETANLNGSRSLSPPAAEPNGAWYLANTRIRQQDRLE